jgi:ribonuclease HI
MNPPLLTIHTDGASRGNPGDAAFAYTIARDGQGTIEDAGCLGELTNNQAEYTALVRALRRAIELGPQHRLLVNSDSELMVKQMKGEYRVKNEELRPLYEEAVALARRFQGGVEFRHVRRGQNSRADALCNEALDGKRPTPRPATAKPLPARKPATLREEAVGYLRDSILAWVGGEDGPSAEEMWEQLRGILERHGARLPSSGD